MQKQQVVWWDKRPPLEPSFKLTDFIATPRVKFLPLLKSVEVEQQLVSKFWTLTCKVVVVDQVALLMER